jgi:uncharacterized protein YndB with AHSA1/START domain
MNNQNDRELNIERIFNAPRELVFNTWTDPKHIVNWWDPTGFTTTIHIMDVQPGGKWELTMHGPDGTDYKNKKVYVDVVQPERIVLDQVSNPKHRMTATFTEQGSKTLVAINMLFESAEQLEQVIKVYKADEGLKQNMDKLDSYLCGELEKWGVTITRVFNAPREMVFKAWTEPEQMMRWWGPHGFTNPICEMNVVPGGSWEICMHSTNFPNHWAKGVYLEINAPERLVFTSNAFEDGMGNFGIHTVNTVAFEEYEGKTKLTLNAVVVKLLPELQFAFSGMETGWGQSLEKLSDLLANK